jgi:hypothetical protein
MQGKGREGNLTETGFIWFELGLHSVTSDITIFLSFKRLLEHSVRVLATSTTEYVFPRLMSKHVNIKM